MAELELNKIVGMIMENPELVEKIKAMGKENSESTSEALNDASPPLLENSIPYTPRTSKRNELLRALQSFLSEERKKNLETMMTLADVLDTVRKK